MNSMADGYHGAVSTPSHPSQRSRFFQATAIVCLAILIVGFSRTFFLKPFFDTPALPAYVHLHGWIWTAWVTLLVLQTRLIGRGDVRLHRRVGKFAAAFAAFMVAYGLLILYLRIMKYHDPARDLSLSGTTALIWANLNLLAAFAVFVTLGVLNRHRAAIHKRFMLLATFSMMGQPLGRFAHIESLQISDSQFVNEIFYGLGGLLILLLALPIYDWITRGKPYAVSILSPVLLLTTVVISATVIPNSDLGRGLILYFA